MSKRGFEDVNKEYALACAKLGEIEVKSQGLRDSLTDLANEKAKGMKEVQKLVKEAQALQANSPAPIPAEEIAPTPEAVEKQ